MSCNYCGGSGMNAYYQECPYCDTADDSTNDEPEVVESSKVEDSTTSEITKEQSEGRSDRDEK